MIIILNLIFQKLVMIIYLKFIVNALKSHSQKNSIFIYMQSLFYKLFL